MSLIESVYESIFVRKQSTKSESKRLGIKEAEFSKIRNCIHQASKNLSNNIKDAVVEEASKIYRGIESKDPEPISMVTEVYENMEKGECKITGISSEEPKSPEEIIEILNIDTTKWKLSQYWNKQKSDRWVVSALVTKVKDDEVSTFDFLASLENYKIPKIKRVEPAKIQTRNASEKVCAVMSLQDLHFGKPGNENMDDILLDAVKYLVEKSFRSHHLQKIILVVGPDTLNMDTFNGTTTKGTPVENSETAQDAYIKAFNAVCKSVGFAVQYCDELEVVFVPGNHDRLSSFHLLHAVSQAFTEWPTIKFNVDYAERKVLTYGDNMIAFEHGDITAKNNPLVFAVEFPKEWGSCKNRMLYTGHWHGRKTLAVITENEEHGFVTRVIPALTSSDYYHYHNKYVGNKRSALIHLHDSDKGLISEFVYSL